MTVERCFQALGLTERPENEEALREAYERKLATINSGTESDRLAKRLAEENYEMGLRVLREE